MTFQAKSAMLMTIALVVVYGIYFFVVGSWATTTPADQIVYQPLMIAAIVPLVILAVLGHVVIALINPKEAAAFDERDRLIDLRGERIGAYVLAVGVFVGLVLAMVESAQFWIAQALLLAWVLAEISDNVSKLVLYRRGA